jgi:hypothetical protein
MAIYATGSMDGPRARTQSRRAIHQWKPNVDVVLASIEFVIVPGTAFVTSWQ